ncbi:glutathione S-transferase Mu 4-like [Corticium candelabrum]|uniref:glutathione S-transferase Mu 4-like n=1 Tax=Corticium candelabrum TaxID=121492 RepID=UPI002E25417C|nr:glutathione S-transferase Mu 4-like [Corticium candelabrum]
MTMKLGYWDLRGLCQPIRLLLAYKGEQFEEKRYEVKDAEKRKEWQEKDKLKTGLDLPFPNLPYLIDGDRKLVQSQAILYYLGRKYNMCGKTEDERVRVDVSLHQALDLRRSFTSLSFASDFADKKPDYLQKLPTVLQGFVDFIGGRKWLAGDELTISDFHFYEQLAQHLILDPSCLDKFPRLQEYVANFEGLPAIKAYRASSIFIKRPINSPFATFT